MPTHETTTALFNQIAPKYDLMNHLMSFELDRLWRRRAVRRIADKRQPLKVLDLATGTGDLAIATARRMGADGTVTGVDLSEEMLIQGRFKVADEGLQKNIELIKGNAESLPFNDDSFDRVSVAFGVRNYENLADGLREACGVRSFHRQRGLPAGGSAGGREDIRFQRGVSDVASEGTGSLLRSGLGRG